MIGFWILAAMMTLVVVLILAYPLFETRRLRDESGYALSIYRDQLTEIERDQQRGVLPADQARAAQLEIQRRILALADEPAQSAGQRPGRGSARAPSRGLIAVLAILLPVTGLELDALALLHTRVSYPRPPEFHVRTRNSPVARP